MTKDEALRLALDALENSVDLVREDAYNAEQLYGNYPARQGKVRGLKVLADDHEKAITAIKAALVNEALERKAENARELGLDYEPLEAKDEKANDELRRLHDLLGKANALARIRANKIDELEQRLTKTEAQLGEAVWNYGELKREQLANQQKTSGSPINTSTALEAKDEPVAWEGGESWESLAWQLCADECGEEACTELIWEGGPIPEPWGDRWMKYEDEAKRLIALVRKHTTPPQRKVD